MTPAPTITGPAITGLWNTAVRRLCNTYGATSSMVSFKTPGRGALRAWARAFHKAVRALTDATEHVSPSQVLEGLRAAYAYCRAMEVIRGGLVRAERQALKWCLHAQGEWAAVWEGATSIERAEASDLIAEIAEYIEPTQDVADGLALARRERAPGLRARRRRLLPDKPS